jgi:hypothetical protein
MLNDYLDRQMQHARVTPVHTNNLEEDTEYREAVKDVLNGRSLGEFAGQIGLSKRQAQSMSHEEIISFVRQAEENLADGSTPRYVIS